MDEFLLEELAKTGFPLEIEVSELLDTNWLVFNNQAYVDEDEGKTRDIDIFGIHEIETAQLTAAKPTRIFIATDLAVECKKSDTHAWVFLTRKKQTPPGFGSGQRLDFLNVFSAGKSSLLDESGKFLTLPKLHFDMTERIAHTGVPLKLAKVGKDKSDSRDDIFEARNQLMKYSFSEMKRWTEIISQDLRRREVIFMFLAIIFDGQLYEATKEKGELTLQKSDHILLRSARYSKSQGTFSEYLIDVVSKEGIPKYLTLLNKDIELLRGSFASKKGLADKSDSTVKNLNLKRTVKRVLKAYGETFRLPRAL